MMQFNRLLRQLGARTFRQSGPVRFSTEGNKQTPNPVVTTSATLNENVVPGFDVKKESSPLASPAIPPVPEISTPIKPDINMLINPKNVFVKVDNVEPVAETEALKKSVPFDEVPGPKVLYYISKAWSFVPIVGTEVTASTIQYLLSAGKIFGSQLSWRNSMWLFRYLQDTYGPVVRLPGPFGGDVVILSRPEHANAIFQNEGPYPVRSSLDCVEKYRLQYRKYLKPGPFLMYGPEWEKLRKTIAQPLQKSVHQHYDKIEKSCDDLIARILRIRNRQEEVPANFKIEIFKWSLECLCSIVLNKRLGFLDICGLSATSDPAKLLEGLTEATDAIRRCENGLHLWKFVETPAWKSLVKHCEVIDTILNRHVRQAQDALRLKKEETTTEVSSEKLPLLESLLLMEGVVADDVLTLLLDMLIVGVNATSHAVAFLLYHLARNPRAQNVLYNEIKNATEPITKENLLWMPYLKACIKESLRLRPPLPILSRVLSKDVMVHNYRIPKGTYVLMAMHLSSLREEYFEDALKFKPERWLGAEIPKDSNSFATIPFGHGPKACLAKEMAEIKVSLLMVKLLRKFRIEYQYGDIKSTNKLLAQPDRPLKFRFINRV